MSDQVKFKYPYFSFRKLKIANDWFSTIKSVLRIFSPRQMKNCTRFKVEKWENLSFYWSDKGFKGTGVNQVCPSLNGGSHEITAKVYLTKLSLNGSNHWWTSCRYFVPVRFMLGRKQFCFWQLSLRREKFLEFSNLNKTLANRGTVTGILYD